MRTTESVSPIAAPGLAASFLAFIVMYAVVYTNRPLQRPFPGKQGQGLCPPILQDEDPAKGSPLESMT